MELSLIYKSITISQCWKQCLVWYIIRDYLERFISHLISRLSLHFTLSAQQNTGDLPRRQLHNSACSMWRTEICAISVSLSLLTILVIHCLGIGERGSSFLPDLFRKFVSFPLSLLARNAAILTVEFAVPSPELLLAPAVFRKNNSRRLKLLNRYKSAEYVRRYMNTIHTLLVCFYLYPFQKV
jgi:hypothetical protein